ncbi:MAG: DUF1214 domain-containing protein [Actinobacteria bacterium]|nr:MAG: DUF1214 domain-containing protein [Actinomycetota bacterium]
MNPADVDAAALAAAWEDFCTTLREAGRTILRPEAPQSSEVYADGFLHLTQLLSLGIDFFVANADGDFPQFNAVITPTRKWALDNPDSLYDRAPVTGTNTYRIAGQRGSTRLMLFDVNEGMTGSTRTRRQRGHLTSRDLEIEDDGTFEIIVSADEQDGNWLPLDRSMTPFDFGLIIRQYFADEANETPATYTIECVDGPKAPSRRSPAHVARGLHEAAGFVRDSVDYWAMVGDELAKAPNQLLDADPQSTVHAGANPDNAYRGGMWRLQADEALVIDIRPAPKADFWNFYICNYWWEDIDDRHHRMNVNSSNANLEADGSLRIVISEKDLGYRNHLETAGNREGMMLLRMTFPEAAPSIECTVVSTNGR